MRAIFAASITAFHLAISSLIRAFNLSGLEGRGSLPSARKRSITLGSASSPESSEFKRATIESGKPAGATRPIQPLTSNPGKPASARSGNRENAHFAASDVFQQDYRGIDHEVDAPAEQLCQGLRATTIGHMLKLNLCLLR